MATIVNEGAGRKRIQIVLGDKRPSVCLGKVSRKHAIGVKLHISRTALGMKALAFVVTSRSSSRRVKVEWTSYCEEQSDDGYTETFQGKLSALRLVTRYPQVFDGATQCNVVVNVAAIKGFRVNGAVFSY